MTCRPLGMPPALDDGSHSRLPVYPFGSGGFPYHNTWRGLPESSPRQGQSAAVASCRLSTRQPTEMFWAARALFSEFAVTAWTAVTVAAWDASTVLISNPIPLPMTPRVSRAG